MKKYSSFFALAFLILAGPKAVNAENIDWNNLDIGCFSKKAVIESPVKGTVKVKSNFQDYLFFVQDDLPLNNKRYSNVMGNFVNYKVLKTSGLYASVKTNHLNDNNPSTFLEFDPYSKDKYSILLDMDEQMKANSFYYSLVFSGSYEKRFFISLDNKNFIEVDDFKNYDFRYLKVDFTPIKNATINSPLKVSGLSIYKNGYKIFLVNSSGGDDIGVYSGYICQKKEYNLLRSSVVGSSIKDSFPIDASTKTYSLSFGENPDYNSDIDSDGILNEEDNCKEIENENQIDSDFDGIGDACDLSAAFKDPNNSDKDNDRVIDFQDNCPTVNNPKQKDSNSDGRGDLCSDDDHDGFLGYKDNCVYVKNASQKDINNNGVGDACEFDKDSDGVFDSVDNCINKQNPKQEDADKDGIGNSCDNCGIYNPRQIDADENGVGDECEKREEFLKNNDDDNDGKLNGKDNCQDVYNPNQADSDLDGVGDVCDNCRSIKNYNQKDTNGNKIGDICEDVDSDGVVGYRDNCPEIGNEDQADADNDGVGDLCEDDDADGVLAGADNCPIVRNANQRDVDKDGVGDACDNHDNRIVESNKTVFKIFIGVVVAVFLAMIFIMAKKISKPDQTSDSNENN